MSALATPGGQVPAGGIEVLVIGSINADVSGLVAELPRPGETVALLSRAADALGGKGANQAAAAAAMGVSTALVGAVGSDRRGQWLLEQLTARGVGTGLLVRAEGPSGWAHILVDQWGENLIIVDAGANSALTVDQVESAFARRAPAAVLVQLEVPLPAARFAIDAGRACGAITICNASPPLEGWWPADGGLDYLLVNRHEAARLAGRDDVAPATQTLADRTGAVVVTTLGADGVLVADRSGLRAFPPAPAPVVVDTTGAGDVFAGAFTAALVRGAALDSAVRAAARAGAWSVGRRGVVCPRPEDLLSPIDVGAVDVRATDVEETGRAT